MSQERGAEVANVRRASRAERERAEGDNTRRNKRVRVKDTPSVSPPERVPMRERMRARAAAVRALGATLRRPMALLLRAIAVLAIGAGAIALGRLVERHVRSSPAFAVKTIEVTGHARLSQEEILETAGLAFGRNVFDVSPEEARARLSGHAWIANAEVQRRLPDAYRVTVRERVPVAVLLVTEPYLVGDDGTVFKRVEEGDPVDLPVITGVDRARFVRDRAFRASLLLAVVALLHEYRGVGLFAREPIAEVHVEADDALTLYTGSDAMNVRLGHGPYRPKLARLRRVLDDLSARGARAAYVYLDNERRPDRVTVRVRTEPAIADAAGVGAPAVSE